MLTGTRTKHWPLPTSASLPIDRFLDEVRCLDMNLYPPSCSC